jgi:stage III sporulation protein SpoIIIAA
MTQIRIIDDLDALLNVLPKNITDTVRKIDKNDRLLEVILDLGRIPTARYTDDEEYNLSKTEITQQDILFVVDNIGEFNDDNRAGLERTLHRIAAIRNRAGHIVGLTCRVGRAVYGTLDIIEDWIMSGKNLLILGQPGVGKTTMLREAARVLSEKKRVVIVDTSNEIGGDGDVPHPAVGMARRMQVAKPSLQHEVMIEAVENHYPQVIVIDEIGRELEAAAARTIAERGVQLIGTAHGYTLENLLLNPTLSDLIGGIESVTLSDEEARRRNTQKTVLERRSPPTFDVLIELQSRNRVAIHTDVSSAVDALLRERPLPPETRFRDENDEIHIEKPQPIMTPWPASQGGMRRQNGNHQANGRQPSRYPTGNYLPDKYPQGNYFPGSLQPYEKGGIPNGTGFMDQAFYEAEPSEVYPLKPNKMQPIRIYPYGVARNRLQQAARRLGVPAVIVDNVSEAQTLVTLRTYYRKHQATVVDAERRGMPIYVLRSNTVNQMQSYLSDLFNLRSIPDDDNDDDSIVDETRAAIEAVLNGEPWVDLTPASSFVRRQQHEMARQARLLSHSMGKDPYRRVRIYRE